MPRSSLVALHTTSRARIRARSCSPTARGIGLALAMLLACVCTGAGAVDVGDATSAWHLLRREAPAVAAALPTAERRLLRRITPAQLHALLAGEDPGPFADGGSLKQALGIDLDPGRHRFGPGNTMQGGGYVVHGRFGDWAAGTIHTGGGLRLTGGLAVRSSPTEPRPDAIFSDGFEDNQ